MIFLATDKTHFYHFKSCSNRIMVANRQLIAACERKTVTIIKLKREASLKSNKKIAGLV